MTIKVTPPVTYKYSKSSAFYLNAKKDFFSENSKLFDKALKQNQLYASQPKRILCKLCQKELPQVIDFVSHGVSYTFCLDCSHLNGNFDDTKLFIEELYILDGGSDYSSNYIDNDFAKRAMDIYIPKVDFFISSVPMKQYRILDVGCGSGYFVYAAQLKNLIATGIDVNKTMIDFGNRQISHLSDKSPLDYVDEDGFYESIINSNAEVISAIGVIEHLREPHKFFDAFSKSKAKYLFYSVPMFSLSVIVENIFKDVFPRQLSGGHTHLFTEDSIKKIHSIVGVKSIAEWRFGTDIMDLYRSALTSLQKNKASQKLIEYLENGFANKIDDIQAILDKNHFCSEIHCVAMKE